MKNKKDIMYFGLISIWSVFNILVFDYNILSNVKSLDVYLLGATILSVLFYKSLYKEEFENKQITSALKWIILVESFLLVIVLLLTNILFVMISPILSVIIAIISLLTMVLLIVQNVRAIINKRIGSVFILISFILFSVSLLFKYCNVQVADNLNNICIIGMIVFYYGSLTKRHGIAHLKSESLMYHQTQELIDNNEKLTHLLNYDELTNAHTRKFLMDDLNAFFDKYQAEHKDLTLISFDIDRFKNINDTYGHPVGDRVLVKVCSAIDDMLEENYYLARIGGEEFVILLPDTVLAQGRILAEEFRKEIEQIVFIAREGSFNITCSFGVAQITKEMKCFEDILTKVDNRLYEAKRSGRNTVR